MILPKYIYDVLNSPIGFDMLLVQKMKSSKTNVDAYYAAVEEVQQYIPNFKEPYNGQDSYKVKMHVDKTKEVFIPEDVVAAAVHGIWDIFEVNYLKKKIKKMAYDLTMEYINKYLPNYQPYRNYESFRIAYHLRKKKQVYAKKRNARKG